MRKAQSSSNRNGSGQVLLKIPAKGEARQWRQSSSGSTRQNFAQRKLGGFTLIELLVAIGILGVIAGVGVTIFASISAAYNKSLIINELRREGSRVTEEIERVIRSATDANCSPLPCSPSSALVLTIDDETLEYEQNGNCDEVSFLRVAGGLGGGYVVKELQGTNCSRVGQVIITDTDSIAGVNVEVLTFAVAANTGRPDVVEISLQLSQALGAPQRGDYQASVNLASKVSTRAY